MNGELQQNQSKGGALRNPNKLWGSMCHYQAPPGPTKITPTLTLCLRSSNPLFARDLREDLLQSTC